METNSTQQEILLFTGTHFSSRQWSKKDDGKPNNMSDQEQLLEACWNGLVQEMLPELNVYAQGKKMFLWNVREAKSFIELELGDEPLNFIKQLSIDPYLFMETVEYN